MNKDEKLELIKKKIQEVANEMGIHPTEITQANFLKLSEGVTPWQLRKYGGFTGILNAHFPLTTKDLVAIKEQKEVTSYIKSLEKKLSEKESFEKNSLSVIERSVSELKLVKLVTKTTKFNKDRKNMTIELMLSDIHYGKKFEGFDLEICRKRVTELVDVLLSEVKDNQKLFNVERIIVALLGDIIESFTMHGIESALGCEFGNTMQIDESIQSLYEDVLVPLAALGIPIDIPCVTGNHDRVDSHRTFQNPGQTNMTWIIYNALERLCRASGFKHMKFYIPKEPYVVLPIYKNFCLYEHGDNTKANTKIAFENLMSNRSKQVGKVLDFGRFGHYHAYACYDRGRVIVNESVCGQDSYANVLGHNSTPGQTINYYIETDERSNCFYKSFPVYLGVR